MIEPFKKKFPEPPWIEDYYQDLALENFRILWKGLKRHKSEIRLLGTYTIFEVSEMLRNSQYCDPLLFEYKRAQIDFVDGFTVLKVEYDNKTELRKRISYRVNELHHFLRIDECLTDLDIELAVNDWLVRECEWCDLGDYDIRHSVIGILLEQKGVCLSFAQTASLLLNCFGVECHIIHGIAPHKPSGAENYVFDSDEYLDRMCLVTQIAADKERICNKEMPRSLDQTHAWNYVKIEEKWRQLDATFNAAKSDNPIISYKHRHFNLTNGEIKAEGREILFGPKID